MWLVIVDKKGRASLITIGSNLPQSLSIGVMRRHSDNELDTFSCVTALGLSEKSDTEDIALTGKTGIIWKFRW